MFIKKKEKKSNKKCMDNGATVLVGSFSLHLALGSMYLWGAISIYVASYLKVRNPSITLDNLFFTLPISMMATALCSSLGPLLLKYISPKL